MSDTAAPLAGPDLAAGIPAHSLEPGGKLLGHAFGDSVLLARLDDRYVAIGATCTHYGGPLAEGAIDGESVRCPWHHACFSLRTGEALRAPALSPVACYTVEQDHETVRVTGKVERDPLAPSYPIARESARHPRAIVMIGAGAAGSAAAEMLRRCGYDGDVTIIDGERTSPYDRPNLSKDFLAGNAPPEWIPLRPDGFYEEHRINIVRARATRIDVNAKRVEIENAAPIAYDALLIASGAEPIRLDTPGFDDPRVHYLRSLADSQSIIDASPNARRIVVIGASFIGLEVAASLRTRGLEVAVVAPESVPLERVLGRELGEYVRQLHESHGVAFHLERTASSLTDGSIVLSDGTRLPADLVVVGVGVRPRVQLAEVAELAMNKGIVVDEFLETSAPGIYAAGDIARWPDPHTTDSIRVEHWVVAQRMGQTAARNMLGAAERFAQVPFFWSAHYDKSINYVGHAEKWDSIAIHGDLAHDDAVVRYTSGGKVIAVATVFRDAESLDAELTMERDVG